MSKSKPSPGGYKRLKDLGQETMDLIDMKLLGGTPAGDIATYIQVELGQCKDIKHASLKKTLERYKAGELRRKALEQVAGVNKDKAVKVIHRRMNAMEELQALADAQRERVGKLLLREAQLPNGMLLGDVKHEARLLKDMLVDLGRLQLETGVLHRAPKRITGSLLDANGETREFTWTEEQERLFETLTDGPLIEGEVVDVEADD